jgi:group I intron endonuclease
MEKKFIVYCHKNKANGKVYIGITSNKSKRWIKTGIAYQKCFVFFNAILKYGFNNFEHNVLFENLTKEEACKKEVELIEVYNSTNRRYGYNVSKGGEAFMLGYKFSDKQKKEMSEKRKGKNKGIRVSPESEFKNGHTPNDNTRKKMSKAKLGKPTWNKGFKGYNSGDKNPMKREEIKAKFKGAKNTNSKKILQYTKDNNFIKKWDCMSDAAKEYNIAISNITKCCQGECKTIGGFIFKYANYIYPLSTKP